MTKWEDDDEWWAEQELLAETEPGDPDHDDEACEYADALVAARNQGYRVGIKEGDSAGYQRGLREAAAHVRGSSGVWLQTIAREIESLATPDGLRVGGEGARDPLIDFRERAARIVEKDYLDDGFHREDEPGFVAGEARRRCAEKIRAMPLWSEISSAAPVTPQVAKQKEPS